MEITREQIEQMPAGRELDAVIEEALFARAVTRNWPCMINGDDGSMRPKVRAWRIGGRYEYKEPTTGRGYTREVVPRYSTDIAAAWQVFEKVRQTENLGHRWCPSLVFQQNDNLWHCEYFTPLRMRESAGETAPLAICRAALLAVLPYPPKLHLPAASLA